MGNEIVIAKGDTCACPVEMLRKYVDIAGIDKESDNFLFKPIFKSKSTVSLIHKSRAVAWGFRLGGKNFGDYTKFSPGGHFP